MKHTKKLLASVLLLCGAPLFAQNLACTPNGDGTLNCVPQPAAQAAPETELTIDQAPAEPAVQSIDAAPAAQPAPQPAAQAQPEAVQPVAQPAAQPAAQAQPEAVQPVAPAPGQQLYVMQPDGTLVPAQVAAAPTAPQAETAAAAPAPAPGPRRSGLFYAISFAFSLDYLLYEEANASLGGGAFAMTARIGGGNDRYTAYFIYSKHVIPDPTYEDDYTEFDYDGTLDFENYGFGATLYGSGSGTFSAAFGLSTSYWWEGGGIDYAGPFVRLDAAIEGGGKGDLAYGIEFTWQMTLADDYVAHFLGVAFLFGHHAMADSGS